jgi:PPOX class probable F420-dependent enzyme
MPNVMNGPRALASSQYVVVTSYRRDGTPVETPVWVVGDGDALAVWTPRKSYKVRRIMRNPAVTVAPCTFDGTPLGPALPARAEIMDRAGLDRVRAALKRKYGVVGWLTVVGSRLRRGVDGTVAIRIIPEQPDGSSTDAKGAQPAG